MFRIPKTLTEQKINWARNDNGYLDNEATILKQTLSLCYNNIMESSALDYLDSIVSKIKLLNPYKVILFGSAVTGTLRWDSDLDLLVVLDTEKFPANYDERLENRMIVSRAIMDFNLKVPIDLIVYTRSEYKKFLELDGPKAKEINRHGKVVYERTY